MKAFILLTLKMSSLQLLAQKDTTKVISFSDTTIVINNRIIKVNEAGDKIDISVYEATGDTLSRIYETSYQNGKKETRWEISESINYPLSDYIHKKNKKKRANFTPHWAGVGFGFVNAMNSDFHFINDNSPHGVYIDFGRSFEIFWNIFDIGVPLYQDKLGFVFGLGLDWRNYVMTANKYFTYSDYQIQVKPMEENDELDFSRIKTVDLTLPVLLEYQINVGCKKLYLQGGAQVNFRTHSSLRNKYKLNGYREKYYKDGIGSNPVNLDLVLKVGFENIGFYSKYSPNRMFQTGKGPEMHAFSMGVALTY